MALKCHLKVRDRRRSQVCKSHNCKDSSLSWEMAPRNPAADEAPKKVQSLETGCHFPQFDQPDSTDSYHYVTLTLNSASHQLASDDSGQFNCQTRQFILKQIVEGLTGVNDYFKDMRLSVFKFRNIRGSHIPLNMDTIKNCNSSQNPLVVEICDRYSVGEVVTGDGMDGECAVTLMQPEREKQRSLTAHSVCCRLNARLARLEDAVKGRQSSLSIQKQLADMAQCLHRLQHIIDITSHNQWQGTIQRNPLW